MFLLPVDPTCGLYDTAKLHVDTSKAKSQVGPLAPTNIIAVMRISGWVV
jgi:hypothetical protein